MAKDDLSLAEAINHLQTHAHGMRAVIRIADEIKSVDDIKRLGSEAEAVLKEKRDELATIDTRIEGARKRLSDVDNQGKVASAAAVKAKDDATSEAKAIVAKAREDARSIVGKAQDEADAASRAAQGELDKLNERIAETGKRAEVVDKTLRTQVEDLEARAKKARDYLSKLAE